MARPNKRCDRDCFHCKYEDCITNDVTTTERSMQNYRDYSYNGTMKIPKAHSSGARNKGRKGGRYD